MKINAFNNTVNIWIKELDKFPFDLLLIKPDEKSWSLGQLYEHILEETLWYNEQIEISLLDREHLNDVTPETAQVLFDAGSFADKRFPGLPSIADNVKQPSSKESLKAALEKLQKDTNVLSNKMQACKEYGKAEHPGYGYFDCYEWLQYSEMHMRHHLNQKARIENFLMENHYM